MTPANQFRFETLISETRTVCLAHTDPKEVWGDVLKQDEKQIGEFYNKMKVHLKKQVPWWIISCLAKRYYDDITRQDRKYINECKFFADQCGVFSHEEMVFLQIQATIANYFPGGCTTVAMYDEQAGNMVCMRSMDWGAADIIAKNTRIFNLQDQTGNTIGKVAGIAGMVGVLTAVKDGFAVVGNYAPRRLDKDLRECLRINDPSFLLRKLIEDDSIKTYQHAVDNLKSWKVGAPFFITLCGVERGEACTVEFGGRGAASKRDADANSMIIQTNHYPDDSDYREKNRSQYPEDKYSSPSRWYCSKLLHNSSKRLKMMERGLQGPIEAEGGLKEKIEDLLRIPPMMNHESAHWAFMRPADTSMEVTALVDAGTCYKSCNFLRKLFCKYN